MMIMMIIIIIIFIIISSSSQLSVNNNNNCKIAIMIIYVISNYKISKYSIKYYLFIYCSLFSKSSDPPAMELPPPDFVVGIDFGTTYSGFAFASFKERAAFAAKTKEFVIIIIINNPEIMQLGPHSSLMRNMISAKT